MNPGLCLVHKEVGESSFDVVRRFKRAAFEAGLKKWPLGHGGTLDPFADGLLLVHVSNRYIDLDPIVAALAKRTGMMARLREDLQPSSPDASASVWVALARDPATIARLEAESPPGAWQPLPETAETVWSDDFASVLPYLRWDRLERVLP